MRALTRWLEDRTGCCTLWRRCMLEPLPGSYRWRQVWGAMLGFAFLVELITGLFLWMAYSPGAQSAWESVYHLQYETTGGALLRSMHYWTAQLMLVLLVLHVLQVVLAGAYRAPREVNFWIGLLLLKLTLLLIITGELLPWDQNAYWGAKVRLHYLSLVPSVGPLMARLAMGGADLGHATLTRFTALHAGVLPAVGVLLVLAHVAVARRQRRQEAAAAGTAVLTPWPDRVLKDAVGALAVLAAVLVLAKLVPPALGRVPYAAHLGPPANPADFYPAARPDWNFLFLFEFVRLFPGSAELWGAVLIPGLAFGFMFLMPFVGRWRLGHRFNAIYLLALLVGAGVLMGAALRRDANDAGFQAAVRAARQEAERAVLLARHQGIPPEGAAALLARDPLTQGPKLFARHCASCHRYDGHDGLGQVPKDPPTASDLKGFASREWLRGLLNLEGFQSLHYFGGTKFKDGKMARFLTRKVANYDDAKRAKLQKVILALSAEAGLRSQASQDAADAAAIVEGRQFIQDDLACVDCHQFQKPDEDATAPDLTGYGSRQWLIDFISDPAQPRFYGKRNDRMPRFGAEDVLDRRSIELIVDWLRGEWFEAPEKVAASGTGEVAEGPRQVGQ